MFLKPCTESSELQTIRYLHPRIELSTKDKQYYFNLEKGYEGEQQFASWLEEKLTGEWIALCDLLLEVNRTVFQIDLLLITQKVVYPFEVKNYEGDFHVENGVWYTSSGDEIKNPLLQLERSDSLLRRLLHLTNVSIKPHLVFVNPEFALFQAPLNTPILLPTQLNRFMKILNQKTTKLHEKHSRLAEQLLSEHIIKSPFSRIPTYNYEQLKKGITCRVCHALSTFSEGRIIICSQCGCQEKMDSAVLRSIEQFMLLFPNKKVTTSTIYDWCKIIGSRKTIRRILSQNFTLCKHGQVSFYLPKSRVNS